jgi:hypothetical protein
MFTSVPAKRVLILFSSEGGFEGIWRLIRGPGKIPDYLGRLFGRNQRLDSFFLKAEHCLAIACAQTIEKQLADVGEGNGVATRDALQRDLPDESSEKSKDGFGVIQVLGAGEEFSRGGFTSELSSETALRVISAKLGGGIHYQHIAAAP